MPDPLEYIGGNNFLKYHALLYIVFGPISQWWRITWKIKKKSRFRIWIRSSPKSNQFVHVTHPTYAWCWLGGQGGWLGILGSWVRAPLATESTPEGWLSLSSFRGRRNEYQWTGNRSIASVVPTYSVAVAMHCWSQPVESMKSCHHNKWKYYRMKNLFQLTFNLLKMSFFMSNRQIYYVCCN